MLVLVNTVKLAPGVLEKENWNGPFNSFCRPARTIGVPKTAGCTSNAPMSLYGMLRGVKEGQKSEQKYVAARSKFGGRFSSVQRLSVLAPDFASQGQFISNVVRAKQGVVQANGVAWQRWPESGGRLEAQGRLDWRTSEVKRTLRKVHKLSPTEVKESLSEITTLSTFIRLWAEAAATDDQPVTRVDRDRIKEMLDSCQAHCDRTLTIVMKLPLTGEGAQPAVDVVHVGAQGALQPQLNG